VLWLLQVTGYLATFLAPVVVVSGLFIADTPAWMKLAYACILVCIMLAVGYVARRRSKIKTPPPSASRTELVNGPAP